MSTQGSMYYGEVALARVRRVLIVAAIIAGLTLWIIYTAAESGAVDTTAGLPAHNHIGGGWTAYLYGNCGSCRSTGSFIIHIQKELNYLDQKLPGFNIAQLPVGGSFGSDDNSAVRAYQGARDIKVDGIVGNQTWSQMESDVFRTQNSFRLQAGLQLRFSMWNECRGFTNNGGPDTLVPILSSGEWNSWKSNYPSNISAFAADCSISGGGGGGGGGSGYYYECFGRTSARFCTTLAPPAPASCTYLGRC